jgi:hypothetical protein
MGIQDREEDLELIILEKLLEKGGEGVTVMDFPEHLCISEGVLAGVIRELESALKGESPATH